MSEQEWSEQAERAGKSGISKNNTLNWLVFMALTGKGSNV